MEKPFGVDFDSAEALISETDKYFKEEQVYRIDHYLAKEPVQNIAVFLGSNVLFRDLWSNRFIEKIEIVVEESIKIEGRGDFYEQTGALRDIVQSHLLQLAALTLMKPCPDVFDFSMVRRRRLEALQSLSVDMGLPVIKAQYQGYTEEVGKRDSMTETFVSLTVKSSDPAWRGVPIQLATGKALAEKLTEVRVYFKKTQSAQANLLKLRLQPNEAIELELWVKKPGYDQELQKLPLDFVYNRHFDRLPDAYEQVIVDAVRSRTNLFASSEEVLASWKMLRPLLVDWDSRQPTVYQPGSTIVGILKNT
jgi:glucose-6-phosphate 1-dehydrogenase